MGARTLVHDMRYQQRTYNTGWLIAWHRARALGRARHRHFPGDPPRGLSGAWVRLRHRR